MSVSSRPAQSYAPPADTRALEPRTVRIGTRGSALALWQSRWVQSLLTERFPADTIELVTFTTKGDRNLEQPLPEIGGKGLFTAELEEAMRRGEIDLAVHSLKDLPVEDAPGLAIGAVCERANVRDVLVSPRGSLDALPVGARVGTSSRRRAAQLRALRRDLEIHSVRGNVETRMRKASAEGGFDAVVLAAAGVERLGLADRVAQYLPIETMLPAPGQGAVAVQCRDGDEPVLARLAAIDHAPTRAAVTAERTFLHALGGGCSSAVAAFAEAIPGTARLRMTALVASLDGRDLIRLDGSDAEPIALGLRLAERAMARGAAALLAAPHTEP